MFCFKPPQYNGCAPFQTVCSSTFLSYIFQTVISDCCNKNKNCFCVELTVFLLCSLIFISTDNQAKLAELQDLVMRLVAERNDWYNRYAGAVARMGAGNPDLLPVGEEHAHAQHQEHKQSDSNAVSGDGKLQITKQERCRFCLLMVICNTVVQFFFKYPPPPFHRPTAAELETCAFHNHLRLLLVELINRVSTMSCLRAEEPVLTSVNLSCFTIQGTLRVYVYYSFSVNIFFCSDLFISEDMEVNPLSETEAASQSLPSGPSQIKSKRLAPKEDGTAQQIMQLLQEIQNPQGAQRSAPFLGENPCIPFFYRPDEQDEVKILVV